MKHKEKGLHIANSIAGMLSRKEAGTMDAKKPSPHENSGYNKFLQHHKLKHSPDLENKYHAMHRESLAEGEPLEHEMSEPESQD